MKKLLFIINPMAGRQQAQTDLYKMVKIFADHDYEVTVYPTRRPAGLHPEGAGGRRPVRSGRLLRRRWHPE